MNAIRIILWQAGLAVSIACSAIADDRVDTRQGKAVSGRIVAETAAEVTIETSGGPQQIPVIDINHIHYEGQPAVMTHAKAMEESSKLNQAADEYGKARSELQEKPLARMAAEFGEARVRARLALEQGDGFGPVIDRLNELAERHRDSRHHFAAQELLARLYLEQRDYGNALRAIESLQAAPWRETQLRGLVHRATLLRGEKKFDEALRHFNQELAAMPETPETTIPFCQALLEKARLLQAMDRTSEQAATIEQAIAIAPVSATAIQAEAYMALGNARLAEGKRREAAWTFLHVQLLFSKYEQMHAEALYNLTRLWAELDHPERAAATQSQLKSDHPKSTWTKKLEDAN